MIQAFYPHSFFMRRAVIRLLISAVSLVALPAWAGDKPTLIAPEPQEIQVHTRAITAFSPSDPAKKQFGALEFIGGLILSSPNAAFGGFSALRFLDGAGERFLAVSDAGVWWTGTLNTDQEKPINIGDAVIGPLKSPSGKIVTGTIQGDSESIAIKGLDVYIGFEATNRVWKYTLQEQGVTGTPIPVALPKAVGQFRFTRGMESLDIFPPASAWAGQLLTIGEAPVRGETHIRGFIVGEASSLRFHLLVRDDYAVTDAAILPQGDILILERRLAFPMGVSTRIRRLKAAGLKEGALMDGDVLFEADMSHLLDNMEGLALHRGADGAQYVTLISDDNYSILQRTLLLRFRLN